MVNDCKIIEWFGSCRALTAGLRRPGVFTSSFADVNASSQAEARKFTCLAVRDTDIS